MITIPTRLGVLSFDTSSERGPLRVITVIVRVEFWRVFCPKSFVQLDVSLNKGLPEKVLPKGIQKSTFNYFAFKL